jgi:hypothetical protein
LDVFCDTIELIYALWFLASIKIVHWLCANSIILIIVYSQLSSLCRFNMLSITELCSRSTSDWPLLGGAGGHCRCADLSALLLRSSTRFTCRPARYRSKVHWKLFIISVCIS